MSDIFTKPKRSDLMSKIRGKDTKIEIAVRSALHNKGLRFRKNVRGLPGTPDIAIKKYNIAIFINGCFWHGHENCNLYREPKSNTEFWIKKIQRNKERDKENIQKLQEKGWHVRTVWECELKTDFEKAIDLLAYWIISIQK